MKNNGQLTLFALDCGATNWRLFRLEYKMSGGDVQMLGEPQPSPMTSFVDRKLPAVICLDPEGTSIESFGETAQQELEDERIRERVRDYFKPCIGAHLEKDPLPHQRRYTHAQALEYTRLLLAAVLDQIREEKWRAETFDDRVCFAFAYPVHWRYDHEGRVFEEFAQLVRGCLGGPPEQARFVAEPDGAILSLQQRGMLGGRDAAEITLIIDVGGSTTDIVAGRVASKSGGLEYIGRYGGPFGGGLYDAELAKSIADELSVPASALADDPSALISLRVSGQRLKESLSRQLMRPGRAKHTPQRTITLVTRDGKVYRRTITLSEAHFRELTHPLDEVFQGLVDRALESIAIQREDIGQVILVGGGAQLFSIVEYLHRYFGAQKVVIADNADEIVGQGIGLEFGASSVQEESSVIFRAEPPTREVAAPRRSWTLVSASNKVTVLHPGVTTIGRGEGNDIMIDDLKASRFHAEFHAKNVVLEIVDLGSTNGTFKNGERLAPHKSYPLVSGDEVAVGDTKFVLS
jgi:hypothetical protein